MMWVNKAKAVSYPQADYALSRGEGLVGLTYLVGYNVPQNYAEALQHLQKCADGGVSFCIFRLGMACLEGNGLPSDKTRAISLFEKVARLGQPIAMRKLGSLYREPVGSTPNAVLAYAWYNLAATYETGWESSSDRRARDEIGKRLSSSELARGQQLSGEYDQEIQAAIAKTPNAWEPAVTVMNLRGREQAYDEDNMFLLDHLLIFLQRQHDTTTSTPAATQAARPNGDTTDEITRIFQSGRYQSLPPLQQTSGPDSSGAPRLTVRNQTAYLLRIVLSGAPGFRTTSVAPGASQSIELLAGTYKALATVDAAGVLPAVGDYSFGNGSEYSITYVISNR
jgi:hypothetical protein